MDFLLHREDRNSLRDKTKNSHLGSFFMKLNRYQIPTLSYMWLLRKLLKVLMMSLMMFLAIMDLKDTEDK